MVIEAAVSAIVYVAHPQKSRTSVGGEHIPGEQHGKAYLTSADVIPHITRPLLISHVENFLEALIHQKFVCVLVVRLVLVGFPSNLVRQYGRNLGIPVKHLPPSLQFRVCSRAVFLAAAETLEYGSCVYVESRKPGRQH